jgi:hypothetical protein
MKSPLFTDPTMFAVVKTYLQAIGIDIDLNDESLPNTNDLLRQWSVEEGIKLRVLAGLIESTPLAHGIMIQSPSGNHLISFIIQEDYETRLIYHQHEKNGTGYLIPHTHGFMDALMLVHRMREVGEEYIKKQIFPDLQNLPHVLQPHKA